MRHFISTLALGLGLLTAAQQALAAQAAEVLLITGRGTATDPVGGGIRELAKGDAIYPGEIINAAVNSYINLKFSDGGFILLRPNSRFVVEDFADASQPPAAEQVAVTPAVTPPPAAAPAPQPAVKPPADSKKKPSKPSAAPAAAATPPAPAVVPPVAPAPAQAPRSSRAFFRLLKGGFRAVSGLIGKANPAEYRVSTPVATIGIRGTDYLVVICDAACARDPILRAELPPEVSALEGGIVTGIMEGTIGVTTQSPVASLPAVGHALLWTGLTMNVKGLGTTNELSATDGTPNYAVVTNDRKFVPLDRPPGFLQRDPIPNPATVCQ